MPLLSNESVFRQMSADPHYRQFACELTDLLFADGRGLSRQRAGALKRAGLFSLAVSIDSPDAEEHNRFRHSPRAFDDAVRALDRASEAGLYTLASAVVYRRHLTHENIVHLATWETCHDHENDQRTPIQALRRL